MENWLNKNLSTVLGFDVPDDLVKYVLSIETEQDLQEYMKTLLDFENREHKSFYVELALKKFQKQGNPGKKHKKKISKVTQSLNNIVTGKAPAPPVDKPATEVVENEGKGKKKTKFINLYSNEGQQMQVVLLKGRHRCNCQASKHKLINNCMQCGRIVCSQEGSGPCLFCGNLVRIPKEEEIDAKNKAGKKLMNNLLEQEQPKGWEEALAHRDKLLEFERNKEQRTHVIDDDSDYFNTSSVWLSESEKNKLEQYRQQVHEKKHASRLTKKMTFDFAGRQVIEDKDQAVGIDENILRDITTDDTKLLTNDPKLMSYVENLPVLQFDPSVVSKGSAAAAKGPGVTKLARVQDTGLLEMSDTGRCLSMHQPWASLLVEGIKLHEGRTWYTAHRGRLWIASAAKPPDDDTVRALENQYRVLCPEKEIKFPSFYPTGCLLGCVSVDECLPQEEYKKLYPDGESDSPFVLICSNPISLRLRFPVKGQHKIYQLDKNIHMAAIKCIQHMAKMDSQQEHEAKAA